MRAAYRWLHGKCCSKPTPVAVVLGLLLTPLGIPSDTIPVNRPLASKGPAHVRPDVRTARLHRFLTRIHSPVAPLSAEFVREADKNHLDWRLLPSISVVESSGGKYYRNNNIFGWDGGNAVFSSVRDGIHQVAFRLGQSPLYKNRSLMGKLQLYNSADDDYTSKVLDVMRQISPLPAVPGADTELAYAY